MDEMDELSRVALIGTQQAGPGLPDAEPALRALFAGGRAYGGRERELLLRAGAAAVYRRAGLAPRRVASTPAPAPAEERRACGPALGGLLRILLGGSYTAVLPEALDLVASARLRLSPELLPDALDVFDRDLRDRLRPVLGERGRWLARLEPAWAWAAAAPPGDALPADADTRWQEGRPDERKSLLALARRVDVDRSRAWLETAWSKERAEFRAELLIVLETGLGPADEAFLVGALSDRSAAVRLLAARLLWRLAGSALSRTMLGRADELIAGYDPRAGLTVRLPPASFDPAWAGEGLVEEPPAGREMGRRQWWLAQTLAAVPPSHWEARLSAPAAVLVAAAAAHEFHDVLIDGLTTAALGHGSSAWIEPLWEIWLARARPGAPVTAIRSALLARMDADARARRACELLASGADDIGALAALDPPWPGAVADAFLTAFAALPRREGGGPQASAHPWEGMLGAAALAMPASHLDRALPVPEVATGDWAGRRLLRLIDEFHAVLAFRRRLHEEISREHDTNQHGHDHEHGHGQRT